MTAFSLKVIAIITMLADHVGMVFFPQVLGWRIVGRLAFPIFAWLIANGYRHTSNLKGYVTRLAMLAVISQAPYLLAKRINFPGPWEWNIFVTLILGLVAIAMYQRIGSRFNKWMAVVVVAVLAEVLRADYGAFGGLLMGGFHVTYGRKWAMTAMMTALVVGFF